MAERWLPRNFGLRWLWVRIEEKLLVALAVASAYFVVVGIQSGDYSIVGAIVGFWMLALYRTFGQGVLRSRQPRFERAAGVVGLQSQTAIMIVIVAGCLMLWVVAKQAVPSIPLAHLPIFHG
ncbi:MAG TPA: hypothetical protein VFW75_04115 [Acetobacteraceae bacterium]|nr:hypothetical protein [Acetobacteraceae bacterium]